MVSMGIIKSNDKIGNININTYGKFKPKEKTFSYCWKCGKSFDNPSLIPFCDDFCRNDYYKELAQDMDDMVGIN